MRSDKPSWKRPARDDDDESTSSSEEDSQCWKGKKKAKTCSTSDESDADAARPTKKGKQKVKVVEVVEDDEDDEVGNHHGEVERVRVINASEGAVGELVPIAAYAALRKKEKSIE